jgi:hypothetical protein
MRRTLTAIMVPALAGAALLLIATQILNSWYWQLYSDAQALNLSQANADAVIVENPYEVQESILTFIPMFIALCAAATFWVVFVVIPSLLASRRVFAGSLSGHIVAAVTVCTLSGVVFALVLGREGYISPAITFAVGGVIGLVSFALVVKLLPPNTSLERTREG